MNSTSNTVVGGTYQQKLERVRKYTQSQGIPLDSPRARKYAVSQGVNPDDLLVELSDVGVVTDDARLTTKKYAKAVGCELSDPAVRKYATSGSENEPIEEVTIDAEFDNDRFKEAVLHYANSQDLSLDDPRVTKYARGLLKPTGDFSYEKKSEALHIDVIEQRISNTVQKYADSMQLLLDDPKVKKYEQGLRNGPYKALLTSAIR